MKKEVTQALAEIEHALLSQCPTNVVADPWYHCSTLRMLGKLPIPAARALAKRGYSFSHEKPDSLWELWTRILEETDCFEVRFQSLLYFTMQRKQLSLAHYPFLVRAAQQVDCWAHADTLCSLLAALYEQHPTTLERDYRRWQRSKNPWLRRCSLVGLFYYQRERRRYPAAKIVFARLRLLVKDTDFYVQRAVGWTLREASQVYPACSKKFLIQYARQISPIAWQAATEKISCTFKTRLKRLRG